MLNQVVVFICQCAATACQGMYEPVRRLPKRSAWLSACLLAAATHASAITLVYWDGSTGNWDDDTHWEDANGDPFREPNSSDRVFLPSGSVTVNMPGEGSNGLYVGDASGTAFLTIVPGGELFNSNATPVMGDDAGSTGTITVTGNGAVLTKRSQMVVGNAGSGTLIVEDEGLVDATLSGTISVADQAGSTGNVIVRNGGRILRSATFVGRYGDGTLRVESGATVAGGSHGIANEAGSTGYAIVTGAGSNWSTGGDFSIGRSSGGIATLDIEDQGRVSAGGTFGIRNAQSTVKLDGGVL